MEVFRVEKMRKTFGAWTLRVSDFVLEAEASWAVVGASGSGKSVFLKCALGFMETDESALYVQGAQTSSSSVLQTLHRLVGPVGIVFQGTALFDGMTVLENVAFAVMQVCKVGKTEAVKRAKSALERVGLDASVADVFQEALSGGMKRRVSVARALAICPKIVVLDEPTAGLDPVSSLGIAHLLESLRREEALTMITVTHDLALARRVATNVLMIDSGSVAWSGAQRDFFTTDHPQVAAFLHAAQDVCTPVL